MGRHGEPELGVHPTGAGCPCLRRSPSLVDWQRLLETQTGKTPQRGGVSQGARADLAETILNGRTAHSSQQNVIRWDLVIERS